MIRLYFLKNQLRVWESKEDSLFILKISKQVSCSVHYQTVRHVFQMKLLRIYIVVISFVSGLSVGSAIKKFVSGIQKAWKINPGIKCIDSNF